MVPNGETITADLARIREAAGSVKDLLLADLTLIGEIPAPTFQEDQRADFLVGRLAEAGYQNCLIDSVGNVSGSLPGAENGPTILLATNLDTVVENVRDQTIEIHSDRVVGPFVGDNSIAVAALATLPALLDRLALRFRLGIQVVAAARCLGRGNLEGIRRFVADHPGPYAAGLCIESVQLGRLNYTCMGMIRGEIAARLPDNFNWEQYGATGSIIPLTDVIQRISQIPLPNRPLTSVIMGAIDGGFSYNNVARDTKLRFELRSESLDILKQVAQQIDDIAEDVAAQAGMEVKFETVAERAPGGIDISHPLVRTARAILTSLGVQPQMYATTSLMAALRDAKIPAITIGITTGERKSDLDEIDEAVAIPPLSTGMAQLVALLQAIDGGLPTP
ncbi:MAG TPA: peptidase [Kiritimatiellia bacterium]|jgi:acetylornithine deacetylase/succinyl-diaminopimelate desuccinylase-like protein